MYTFISSFHVPACRFVRHCEECQQSKKDRKRHDGPLHPIPIREETWYRIGIDLIGPLKTSRNGNSYVMTVTDAYTKWPEASALRTKSAKDVSAVLYSLLYRHGCPAEIVSDQGREFVNATAQQLNAYTARRHKVTAAYHPQTNGLSECMNQTLMNALEKLNNAAEEWEEHIESILFAYRTSKHHSTGFTPFKLMYGREARLHIDLAVPSTPTAVPSADDFNMKLQHLQQAKAEVMEIAGRNLAKSQERQKKNFDLRHSAPAMEVGQCVVVKNSRKLTRKGGKLEKSWS